MPSQPPCTACTAPCTTGPLCLARLSQAAENRQCPWQSHTHRAISNPHELLPFPAAIWSTQKYKTGEVLFWLRDMTKSQLHSSCKTSTAKDDVSQRKQKFLGGLESWRSVCVKGGTFHFIYQISRFYTATTRKGWAQAHSLFPTFGFSYFPHLRPASTTLSAAEQRSREQNACCTSAGLCLFPHTMNIKFIQTKASYSLKKKHYLRGF